MKLHSVDTHRIDSHSETVRMIVYSKNAMLELADVGIISHTANPSNPLNPF